MLTNDDLKKLGGAIDEKVNNLEVKLRGIIREEVDKRIEETELKMEHRFNVVEKRLENIEKQMEQDRRDRSQFFNEAEIFFDEMRSQLGKRIKKLEDYQRISKN